jgi:CheY-like chemotaxis protein
LIVDEAHDGLQALDLLKENNYSVVLLDLLMPNLDGFGVIENLGSAISTPVVLVITGADRALIRQLDPQRIHGVVNKPFDAEDLATLVVACAEIKSRSPFEAMAISAMIAGGPFLAWLNKW